MYESQYGIQVERYTPERKLEWNSFVSAGKNATFLFQRDYMDYHSDRFDDHSLMVSCAGKLIAVLPANRRRDGVVVSHQGLTYGGFVVQHDASLLKVLQVFHAGLGFLSRRCSVEHLMYKRIPRFYNVLPDDEVDYALFLLDAPLARRDCALAVCQADRLPLKQLRKRVIGKAGRAGVQVREEASFDPFWDHVLGPRLMKRYGVLPVHTVAEISLLASRFPGQIKQFSAYCEGRIVAGATIFETPTVAHVQYNASTDEGQEIGAADYLYNWLIHERYGDKRYFDFGICNEDDGRSLNAGLLEWKEGFGARSFAHDFYDVSTANFPKIEGVLPKRVSEPAPA